MTNSQNGWPINPPGQTTLTVAGVVFGGVRSGAVFTVLSYLATRFHHEVEPLVVGTCGAYNPRKIAGTDVWSNHASATAIDTNWREHVQGRRGTFSYAQEQAIRRILAACHGVVRWGGDFSNVDEMHFEIIGTPTAVTAAAEKIKYGQRVGTVDWTNETVKAINFYFSEAYRAQQGKASSPFPPAGTSPTPQQVADRAARNAYVYTSHVDGVDPEPIPEALQ